MSDSNRGQVRFINPEGLSKNPAFTNVITVSGPVETIYNGGQDAVDASGSVSGRPNPPAITMTFVAGLANPDFLVEMEAIAVVSES